MEARVISAHGRQYVVRTSDGERFLCFPRGKKSDIACGDYVDIEQTAINQGVINQILPRQSLLYRSNEVRQKLIAANVDLLVIVVATEPAFSDELITRALVAAESEDIETLIVLNKCDLEDKRDAALGRLHTFETLGYDILQLSAKQDCSSLLPWLEGKTSVLVGQSGMGKSTLVNQLIPEAGAATREISTALDSGKHTTTHATLYTLNRTSWLIDSPGLQEFGLGHLDKGSVEQAFPEFRPFLGACRFRDCNHMKEPNCAINQAKDEGKITQNRIDVFQKILPGLGKR